jgi:hypothetical protein
VLGQALAFWVSFPAVQEVQHARARFIAVALVVLLACAALYHSDAEFNSFAYLGRARWTQRFRMV